MDKDTFRFLHGGNLLCNNRHIGTYDMVQIPTESRTATRFGDVYFYLGITGIINLARPIQRNNIVNSGINVVLKTVEIEILLSSRDCCVCDFVNGMHSFILTSPTCG